MEAWRDVGKAGWLAGGGKDWRDMHGGKVGWRDGGMKVQPRPIFF